MRKIDKAFYEGVCSTLDSTMANICFSTLPHDLTELHKYAKSNGYDEIALQCKEQINNAQS